MPALDSKLRSQLDTVCQQAREKAEDAAQSALVKRAVDVAEAHAHFKPAEKVLRNRLRARGRQAGDARDEKKKTQSIDQLAQELAYEYWHRMLFARFLAENHLLMHPDGVAVSLEECEELAADAAADDTSPTRERGVLNGFTLAARYASKMLPQVFRTDDVLLEIEFAPEHRLALEKLLASLPRETFLADDSLGWVYQFWQTSRKKAVNESGNKIDSRTISSVTQFFTEDYMVQFLLHNTLGAWWAGRQFSSFDWRFSIEEEARAAVAVPGVNWEYLRFVPAETAPPDDQSKIENQKSKIPWTPAAGKFEGWPKTLKEFRLLDPCCGSGHFLVAAFNLLVPLRMHDEGLSAREACDAVLRENLFGLELDPRCTQIAAFALAVAAWKYPDVATLARAWAESSTNPRSGERGYEMLANAHAQPLGYRPLPPLNIACAGIGPQATEDEWVNLAQHSEHRLNAVSRGPILDGLRDLHAMFSNTPTLGSLINPNRMERSLISVDYETLKPHLSAALEAERDSVVRRSASQTHDAERRATMDDDMHERAVAAAGMVKAAELLAGEYTLVITNVPYLGRGKQDDTLKQHLEQHYPHRKADLATAFVERCLEFCAKDGTTAIVTPQNWLFLGSYIKLRESLLKQQTWNLVGRLGPGAFETISGEVVKAAVIVLSAKKQPEGSSMAGIDVSVAKQPGEKAALLRGEIPAKVAILIQATQLKNPDAVLQFHQFDQDSLLRDHATVYQGVSTGDGPRFVRQWWEIESVNSDWELFHEAPTSETCMGLTGALYWQQGAGVLAAVGTARKGLAARSKFGIAVGVTGSVPRMRFLGTRFDGTVAAIVPNKESLLGAVQACVLSASFPEVVRQIDQALSVTESSFGKVPFDLAYWQQVVAEKYPDGLPEPESDDPTQWLFHGRPESSTAPLQVAVARLLGYRWPAELDTARRGSPDPADAVTAGLPSSEETYGRPSGTVGDRPQRGSGTDGARPPLPDGRGSEGMRLSARARDLVRRCEELLPLADRDGLVPIPSVRGETPTAERVLELLQAAYGIQARRASECMGGVSNDDRSRDDPSNNIHSLA